jgi:phosphocarrier protein
MTEITLTVEHEVGLHARPASLFVQNASRFKSVIKVRHDDKEVNAKSILGLLTLGVNKGAVITICADGEDEIQAIDTLTQLVADNFGDPK